MLLVPQKIAYFAPFSFQFIIPIRASFSMQPDEKTRSHYKNNGAGVSTTLQQRDRLIDTAWVRGGHEPPGVPLDSEGETLFLHIDPVGFDLMLP